MSPALAGEFLTTVPPGKSRMFHFKGESQAWESLDFFFFLRELEYLVRLESEWVVCIIPNWWTLRWETKVT